MHHCKLYITDEYGHSLEYWKNFEESQTIPMSADAGTTIYTDIFRCEIYNR